MTLVESIAVAGVASLAAGGALGARRAWLGRALAAQAAGAALLGAAGAAVLAGAGDAGAGFRSAFAPALGIDGLSGFFLLVVALVAVPALAHARDGLRDAQAAAPLAVLTAAFLLALAGMLAARDVTTFLAFWELMTLVPAGAILLARRDREVRRAVFAYLAITHVGGVGVWVALLVLAGHGAIGGAPLAGGGGLGALVAVAALVGFGTKAGLMPLHAWLPRAHPVAPGHVSALMSGVMIKIALYGLVRVLFQWTAAVPLWVALGLLGLGALSALGGVLYALVQHELKRLLAFHSIENVGIIALGLGASLAFRDAGADAWAAIAFGAALLHTANHALFKALLFLGAASFARAVGPLDLDGLGGLMRRMPWTGAAFGVGAMAIAGLPPLNGFASEWLTLQALLHLVLDGAPGVALAGVSALAALGATAALALFCFVKVVGLVLLGEPRRPECAAAQEAPLGMRAAVVALAGMCVALGLLPGLVLPVLADLGPGSADLTAGVGLGVPGTGSLPALWLALALGAAIAGLALAGRTRRAAPAPAWACGQPAVPALRWTSAGFTKPLRLVLESVLRPRREVTVRASGGVTREVVHESEVPHLFDTVLYGPAERGALRGAAFARRLQSGSLAAYLGYLLALLVGVLALARSGVLA